MNAFASELINAFRLAHEHNLELLAVRVVIDVLGNTLIDLVVLNGDVDSDARL